MNSPHEISRTTDSSLSRECLADGTPFTGPLGWFWWLRGIRRGASNPNLCNRCKLHWETGRLSEVTVLFADCRGYTRLTHEFGIEKLAPIMEQFFRTSAEIVGAHQGIVDHFLGDAIMALFNVPIKNDDHVLRAVGVVIAGCSIGEPIPQATTYVVDPPAPAAPAARRPETLRVGNVRVAAAYAGNALVYRLNDVQYMSDPYNAFIADLGAMLGNRMAAWLDSAGPFQTVA